MRHGFVLLSLILVFSFVFADSSVGTLTIYNIVIGGTMNPSYFTMILSSPNNTFSSTLFAGSASGTTVTGLGTYSVSETSQPGYTSTSSGDCNNILASGQNLTCTFTNTYDASITGNLVIYDNIIGGPLSLDHFSIIINSSNGMFSPGGIIGAQSVSSVYGTGSYNVIEFSPPNYATNYSSGCIGTLSAGQTVYCNITNSYTGSQANGSVTVITTVIGGTMQPSDFTFDVGNPSFSPFTSQGSSNGVPVAGLGTFNISEASQPGYNTTYSSYCSGTLASGQSVPCIITNTYDEGPINGKLIVGLYVCRGPLSPSDFTINVGNPSFLPSSFQGSTNETLVFGACLGSFSETTVSGLGSYSVSEQNEPNYNVSASGACSGTLSEGITKHCIITNKYSGPTGTLTIYTNVVGGPLNAQNFSYSLGGLIFNPSSLSSKADG
ncbi:MAG: hypothetical protein NT051_04905, partial [Candidatus Micrarchaeota archaeon]|nr:hypothetical protein [Candidatus Micrarchaeota archaeon]